MKVLECIMNLQDDLEDLKYEVNFLDRNCVKTEDSQNRKIGITEPRQKSTSNHGKKYENLRHRDSLSSVSVHAGSGYIPNET
jgi:hypothetical protein